jgi:hypothetical protein
MNTQTHIEIVDELRALLERVETRRFAMNDMRLSFHWMEKALDEGADKSDVMNRLMDALQEGVADSSSVLWPAKYVEQGRALETFMLYTNMNMGETRKAA